jgi:uncharacterized membrane protein
MNTATLGGATARPSAYHEPKSVNELTDQNVRTIVDLERAAKASAGMCTSVATRIAAFCGTISFVWIHVLWFGGWVFVNSSPLFAHHPDPFPFTFLTLVVSLEAIFLSSFILISQNQETRITERRSQLDLQINLLTEQENTKMLRMLQSIALKVGAQLEADPDLAVLEQATRPERLLEQIERATAASVSPAGCPASTATTWDR